MNARKMMLAAALATVGALTAWAQGQGQPADPTRTPGVQSGQDPKRDAFVRRSGKMQVPYLVDPNTSTALFESADIVRYLGTTYAL